MWINVNLVDINGRGLAISSKFVFLHIIIRTLILLPYHQQSTILYNSDIRNNVLVSDSHYRNVKDVALVIQQVEGDVTVKGMDIRQINNQAIVIYCK